MLLQMHPLTQARRIIRYCRISEGVRLEQDTPAIMYLKSADALMSPPAACIKQLLPRLVTPPFTFTAPPREQQTTLRTNPTDSLRYYGHTHTTSDRLDTHCNDPLYPIRLRGILQEIRVTGANQVTI